MKDAIINILLKPLKAEFSTGDTTDLLVGLITNSMQIEDIISFINLIEIDYLYDQTVISHMLHKFALRVKSLEKLLSNETSVCLEVFRSIMDDPREYLKDKTPTM